MIRCSRTGSHRNGRNVNRAFARQLIELNNRFYRENASSFSATRQAPWAGWEHVAKEARAVLPAGALDGSHRLRVLDLACGNMRLAPFLAQAFPHARIDYTGIDASEDLADHSCDLLKELSNLDAHFIACDVLEPLLGEHPAPPSPDTDRAHDLVCCFGFLHHVPSFELRAALVERLCQSTRPGGIAAISFWQFMHDERLAAKARDATASAKVRPPFLGFDAAQLENDDYLLGWQHASGGYRYCHSFEESELDELAQIAEAQDVHEIARFSADGKSGVLNRYLVLARGALARGA